jgi:hypothetical protein
MKLKFELVNGHGVLVDEEAEIKSDEFYISWEDDYATPKWVIYCKSTGLNGKNPMKIIFAEKELGLDVPVFEWRDFEMKKKSLIECENTFSTQLAMDWWIKGYKSNPANYTESDLRKAFNAGSDYEYAKFYDGHIGYSDGRTIKEPNEEQFIQSLEKYPKYVVMDSKDFCNIERGNCACSERFIDCQNQSLKAILFTNSEGKPEGTVKELIWE